MSSIEKFQQLKSDFQQKLSKLNNYLWGAGLQNPVGRIQQISFLFFLKMLEEQDIAMEREEKLTGRKHKSIFTGKNEKFRWSRWREKAGKELFKFVRDEVFPFIETLQNGHSNIRQIFYDAKLLISDEATLKRAIDIIDTIDFSNLDSDIKGDLYESLLSSIESAGELGQFLTPRHIIKAIIEMVNPKIGETIFDPACGSAGFLITAYDWLKLKNSDPKNIEERDGRKIGYGDKLNKEQWQFLTSKTFHGYDVDPEMTRLALMNLILHGIEGAHVKRKDTVAGAEDEEDLKKYDVILTNPPFAGKVDIERVKPTLPVKSKKTQVLFLGYVINSLKSGGRAGVILPEGSLFGTNRDDKEIRRFLLENTELQAVISMPAGVFQPYAGVKTSFLIFKKRSAPIVIASVAKQSSHSEHSEESRSPVIASVAKQSRSSVIPAPRPANGEAPQMRGRGKAGTQSLNEKIWFFNMKGDGSSLSAAKKFGPQYRNDLPKLLELWNAGEPKTEKSYSWLTPVKDIVENDYILSANTYNPYSGEEEISHRDPKEILGEITKTELQLVRLLEELKKKI